MVHAIDAIRRFIVPDRSVNANIRVLAYMATKRTAPISARIRFTFLIL